VVDVRSLQELKWPEVRTAWLIAMFALAQYLRWFETKGVQL
jgi:hypothetical protein